MRARSKYCLFTANLAWKFVNRQRAFFVQSSGEAWTRFWSFPCTCKFFGWLSAAKPVAANYQKWHVLAPAEEARQTFIYAEGESSKKQARRVSE